MRSRQVILMILVGALLGGCTPQQWRQMQRDHDKRMKQAQNRSLVDVLVPA